MDLPFATQWQISKNVFNFKLKNEAKRQYTNEINIEVPKNAKEYKIDEIENNY